MWKTIKNWAIVKPKDALINEINSQAVDLAELKPKLEDKIEYSEDVNRFLGLAIAHYCGICNMFYKSEAGAAVHKRLKHNKPA